MLGPPGCMVAARGTWARSGSRLGALAPATTTRQGKILDRCGILPAPTAVILVGGIHESLDPESQVIGPPCHMGAAGGT